jgi:predicted nucleic acid-binding protein
MCLIHVLLDTMVLSELRLHQRDPGVVAWISSQRQEDCFLSVVSIGEIERGIGRKRSGEAVLAAQLAGWLDQLLRLYGDRLLPVDVGVARLWGLLSAEIGHDSADLLIAATALERGLTVVTRNLQHYMPTGVKTLNPWMQEPAP